MYAWSPEIISICLSPSFPSGSNRKESVCNATDPGAISGSGRLPGEGNG